MTAPANASNMTLTLPGSITDVISFSVSQSGGETIDVTTVADSTDRKYELTPIGNTAECSVTYFDSGSPLALNTKGTVTIGTETFYGICTSSSCSVAVNDVARFEATFQQVTDVS